MRGMPVVLVVGVLAARAHADPDDDWGPEFWRAQDRAIAACIESDPVPASLAIEMKARVPLPRSAADIEITADHDGAFATCFANQLLWTEHLFGPIEHGFRASLAGPVASPAQILAHVYDDSLVGNCWPRPGSVPSSVRLDVFVERGAMAATATTSPSNVAVDKCLGARLEKELRAHGVGTGTWKPVDHVTRTLEPAMTTAGLRTELASSAPDAASFCLYAQRRRRGTTMTVAVTAARGANDFKIVARSGNRAFDRCVVTELSSRLHEHFDRLLDDGTTYFGIDGDATARIRFGATTLDELDDETHPDLDPAWGRGPFRARNQPRHPVSLP